ncbi:membrane protease FtsH catalytic subunit [Magnetococcus marinus MC-1]|uniref:ATP-dependent zinc metalloprotease FtsH n=1 Tax=Magnetococcus marinus (strain ATCC BAA-1437 / JCM 17883 / MC-1) TaxID=156889 RepID=FTSH_MAGMM|nr:ATP-dependent zinc metalloprotease FtsH [Magnetococcus marinus]A0L4S0.1 RecName: Full=ATP-dependent zinc metalloprotease FtsH [Magnetococcus marinus MC-1]ABK42963.1 membrane protease FtsH catalytic subunit [Magnetococcus marinus MC-1]
MNGFFKNLSLWLVIGLLMVMLFNLFNSPQGPGQSITFSDFSEMVAQGKVTAVTLEGRTVRGLSTDGSPFSSRVPDNYDLTKDLLAHGVDIDVREPEGTPMLMQILISWFPMLLLIAVWIYFMRQMQSGGGRGAMSFGKSKAKLMSDKAAKVTFQDVAGIEEAKEELQEVVQFLKDPHKFQRLGGKIPKGVLLVGPPGTGKTLLARAIAGEANVPFFNLSGSDFVEMFVGVGAARVRDMFEQGKKNAPCIIFIDEIDAVGRHRGAGLGGGHDEREQTLNQLLVEMDGFESTEGVIMVAATNRPDVLDPALLRPGRFDRQVTVPNPDILGRTQILKVHMNKVPLSDSVDAEVIARATPGFSGADLANLVNEAALIAAQLDKRVVEMEDFENAKDKVMMGKPRRSAVISEKERKTTAYHEAGHAVVAMALDGADPVHKVTIIPRGRALGLTMQLPLEDRYTYSKVQLEQNIAILMGGRLAEELVLNQLTTGAGNDIQRATDLARKMICSYGMSDTLGPLTYGENEQEIFLGREITQHKSVSEETARRIDAEVFDIVDRNYKRAKQILTDKMEVLHTMAQALLERETIDADEVIKLMAGEPAETALKPLKKKDERANKPTPTVADDGEQGDQTAKDAVAGSVTQAEDDVEGSTRTATEASTQEVVSKDTPEGDDKDR